MWYPSQQQQLQQQCWHGYIHHLSPSHQQKQQQQQTYSRTSYYSNKDESLNINQTTTYAGARYDENDSLIHYHSTHVDDVYVTGTDYYVKTSTGSYTDDMSSSNTNWNPVITAPPTKSPIIPNSIPQKNLNTTTKPSLSSSSSSSSSSSACWDWLLYSPEIYSNLYVPSSSFIQYKQQEEDDNFDLLASLPTWLLALLNPSMKNLNLMDDENEHDQEISSLNTKHDELLLTINIEKKINNISSNNNNICLSSENSSSNIKPNRSTTPDTDDGYQSASDASRSDYSQQSSLQYDHHNSKDDITTINVPSSLMTKRISYAAACKPIQTPNNNNNNNNNTNKLNSSSISMMKTKTNLTSLLTSNDILNNNGQKSKFIAPRFERMHHAKQYSSSTTTTMITNKESSSSTSFTNRTQIRSNNNHNQRNHIINSSRRR